VIFCQELSEVGTEIVTVTALLLAEIASSVEWLGKQKNFFDVLLTVHLSIFISVFNQLDAQNLFHNKFISCLYMIRAHVLIIRRSKLHYTASGIITPIGVMQF